MASAAERAERIFKTAWFSKAARKAHIGDVELCAAIRQVMLGQAGPRRRSFQEAVRQKPVSLDLLAKGKHYWVYAYLFAKKDRANIEDDELTNFRGLAARYAQKTDAEIAKEMQLQELMEICHDHESQV